MTFTAGTPVAGVQQSIVDITPVLGVGIHAQTGTGAVAFQADIPFRMAGLAGGQVFARLTGMLAVPLVGKQKWLVFRDVGVFVTGYALAVGERGMSRTAAADADIAETESVGNDRQIGVVELVVAFHAELVLMAARAQLLVGPRRDRVRDMEIAAVHVEHAVAERTLLIGEA